MPGFTARGIALLELVDLAAGVSNVVTRVGRGGEGIHVVLVVVDGNAGLRNGGVRSPGDQFVLRCSDGVLDRLLLLHVLDLLLTFTAGCLCTPFLFFFTASEAFLAITGTLGNPKG